MSLQICHYRNYISIQMATDKKKILKRLVFGSSCHLISKDLYQQFLKKIGLVKTNLFLLLQKFIGIKNLVL